MAARRRLIDGSHPPWSPFALATMHEGPWYGLDSGRVSGDVTIPTPHRPERARLTHSVLHERGLLIEQRRDGRSWLEAADGVSGSRSSEPIGPRFHDLAETATFAKSVQLGGRTSAIVDRCPQRHSRRSGPASLPTGGDVGRGWVDAGFSGTSHLPRPVHGRTGFWP
jgi:hypothetical protein